MSDVLENIRRAAFELRETDPQEAVRILRKAAQEGGDAEVLARGALGEIYLEEFGDLDGAEHEFRAVLRLVPGLTAAQIGLARALREGGNFDDAERWLERALQGLTSDLRELKAAEELPPGVEEVVLTALEVAVELASLRYERRFDGPSSVPLDEDLLRWAARERILDAAEDEGGGAEEDWARFYLLWTDLRILTGRSDEAIQGLAEAESAGHLPTATAALLASQALEKIGESARAGAEARRAIEAMPKPWPAEEVVRAAHLLGPPGRELLDRALRDTAERLEKEPGNEHLQEQARILRQALGIPEVVSLGRS